MNEPEQTTNYNNWDAFQPSGKSYTVSRNLEAVIAQEESDQIEQQPYEESAMGEPDEESAMGEDAAVGAEAEVMNDITHDGVLKVKVEKVEQLWGDIKTPTELMILD